MLGFSIINHNRSLNRLQEIKVNLHRLTFDLLLGAASVAGGGGSADVVAVDVLKENFSITPG